MWSWEQQRAGAIPEELLDELKLLGCLLRRGLLCQLSVHCCYMLQSLSTSSRSESSSVVMEQ